MGDVTTIQLDDRRALAYREYGDPDGHAVVNCHGGLLCGLDVAPFDETARELGLRIVSPDRPGLGRSDPAPGRSTADWARDVGQLIDALGIERCAMFGWSMGGQYALACAALLGERVTRTTVVAGCPPLDARTFAQLNPIDRWLTRLAQDHPRVATGTFRMIGSAARHAPRVWTGAATRGAPDEERSAIRGLRDSGIAAAAARALERGSGMTEEYRALARPWGFSPEDVLGTVELWQGDRDDLVPPPWAAELAVRIPDCHLHTVEGAGHFLGYTRTTEVLADLAG